MLGFFVQYTVLDPSNPSRPGSVVVLSEHERSAASADRANPDSERTLVLMEQPSALRIGGMLAFGPLDGMLYVSRGEGGSRRALTSDPLLSAREIRGASVPHLATGSPSKLTRRELGRELLAAW